MDNVTKTTIEALQNGDHKAFEEVFLTYFDKNWHRIFSLDCG